MSNPQFTMNLQQVVNEVINMINVGQQKGVWTLEHAATLNEVVKFLTTVPIMVVPEEILAQIRQQQATQNAQQPESKKHLETIEEEEISMKTTRVVQPSGPRGAETVQESMIKTSASAPDTVRFIKDLE